MTDALSWHHNPGSNEAVKLGCTCAQIDNHYGRGYRGDPAMFIYDTACPMHGSKVQAPREQGGRDG